MTPLQFFIVVISFLLTVLSVAIMYNTVYILREKYEARQISANRYRVVRTISQVPPGQGESGLPLSVFAFCSRVSRRSTIYSANQHLIEEKLLLIPDY